MNKAKKEGILYKLRGILDVIICLILFIMSLYKGGFYKDNVLFTNLIIATLGIIVIVVKLVKNIKNNGIVKKIKLVTIMDFLMLLLPLCYFLPIIFKTYASLEGSISEFITYLNFAIVYFIVRNTKHKNYYINTCIAIAVILATIGIDEITFRSFAGFLNKISINYLNNSYERISSTIQYANITALVIFIGITFLSYKILNINDKKQNSKKYIPFLMFVLTFLNSTIMLTESRMLTFVMSFFMLNMIIYARIKKENNLSFCFFISFVLSITITGLVESAISIINYDLVIKGYISLLICTIVYIFVNNLKYLQKHKLVINEKIKKTVLLALSFICITTVTLIVIMQKDTFIVNNYDESTTFAKKINIYSAYFIGDNDISFSVKAESDSVYEIFLSEVREGDSELKLLSTKWMDEKIIKQEEYNVSGKFRSTKQVKNLKLVVITEDVSVEIFNLKINNKKIKLSYGILPSNLIFKIRDTFYFDKSRVLRFEYYKDAIKLVKKSPLIGIGGEGFLNRYQEVQSSSYISSEVHSVPIQILLEAGALGMSTFIGIVTTLFIMIKRLYKSKTKDDNFNIIALNLIVCFLLVSFFDIVFSFQIMIIVFAILIGIVTAKYIENCREIDEYIVDNKSKWGHIKIAILTLFLTFGCLTWYYSFMNYRASIITVKGIHENSDEDELSVSYIKVAYLETKLKYDKFNISYSMDLNDEYIKHIAMLKTSYLGEVDDKLKLSIEADILTYTKAQKQNIDNMIEYEYYNKYILDKTAKNYFSNFTTYANIYKDQFENEEVAYGFYLGYAMNLTNRILDVASVNKNAQIMVESIYNKYLSDLIGKNQYLKSEAIKSVIKEINKRLKILKSEQGE